MKIDVYNQEGQQVGSVELSESVFGVESHEALVHQYIVNYRARQRQGTASTKGRAEVRGGGRKPWRQKGTGRARSGTIRSPLWRGGGIVFGPKPRKYGSKFPKSMKRLAIKSILSDKARNDRIRVLDKVELSEIKTKSVVSMLSNLNLSGKKCLFLDEVANERFKLSCRNLQGIKFERASLANGYDVLNADVLVLTTAALDKVQEVFK